MTRSELSSMIDNMTVEELRDLQLTVERAIKVKTGGFNYTSTDREVLNHVPGIVHRAKYLVDKYKISVSEAREMVLKWDHNKS